MIGVGKAQVTLCVEIGTAGQALAPCDLVARNLWHSSLERRQASTPSSNHASTLKPIQRRPELARKCLAPERLPPASPPQRLPALLLRDLHSSSPCSSVIRGVAGLVFPVSRALCLDSRPETMSAQLQRHVILHT